MTLDLRTLADEWQGIIDDFNDTPEDERTNEDRAQFQEDTEAYAELCDNGLCIDATPDALRTYGDSYEPTLIGEDEFEDYARELADDLGLIDHDAGWPLNCIDWERAADQLKQDYTSVTYDGDDYYTRSV